MRAYCKLMRMHHYIKNLLIFLPLFFNGSLRNWPLFLRTGLAFFAFCALSSAIYIINDLRDIQKDRLHPTKKNRPLASGAAGRIPAICLSVGLILLCAGLQTAAGAGLRINQFLFSCGLLGLYLCINIGYSLGLKNIPILDIALLSTGYLLRVLYGSALTGIALSKWMYLTVIALSFFFGLGKRRNELARQGSATREVLDAYSYNFLDKNMYLCLTLAICFYALWCIDPLTVARLNNQNLVWTVPLVILICMKYNQNIERCSDGDPVEVLLSDWLLLALVAAFGVITLGIIYAPTILPEFL